MADLDADSPWGAPTVLPSTSTLTPSYHDQGGSDIGALPSAAAEEDGDIDPSEVLRKEELVKEIVAKQDGLRALLERVASVQAEGAKLRSDNETLQTYIDNLTRTNAMAAGAKR